MCQIAGPGCGQACARRHPGNRTQAPLDVYDAALMSVNGPLSEESIAKGGEPIPYPDFTGGRWKTTKPKFAV
ncbi:MAG: hypothetical protein WAU81_05715 [Candidatus Aminicenantales bacterium]